MTTTNLTLYGENSRQIKPAVVNLFQANNNVDSLEFQMANYVQDNVDLSTLDPYAICYGSEFLDGLDEVKLTSEVTEDGILRIYWDLTIMTLSVPQTITYQIVFKGDDGDVWTSYKGILFCNESLTADEEIVAKYPTILKQIEKNIENKTDEGVQGAVDEITAQVNDAVNHVNQIADNFDASVVYIPFGEEIPVEERVNNRLYYQYMNSEHTMGRFEDSDGTILIVDESGKTSYIPIGTVISVDASSKYVPDGSLPCDGMNYNKATFKDLWNNWLTSDEVTLYEEDWTEPIQHGSCTWWDFTYGNGLFVAVGSSKHIATSTDGVTWNEPTLVGSGNWNSVTYANGLFVAVGASGNMATSTDGVEWTTASVGSSNWNSITYADGKFVSVGAAGNIATSTDGVNWDVATVGSIDLNGVVYGNGLFVAVDTETSAYISTNGIDWTKHTQVNFYAWRGVTYGNGLFVGVDYNGNITTSTDGVNWITRFSINSCNLYKVAYANGLFVAVGTYGHIITSTDGVEWTDITIGESSWYSVAHCDGKFIVGGYKYIMTKTYCNKMNTLLDTCSYSEYAVDLATYGQCLKFAVDVAGEIFRVPMIVDSSVAFKKFVVVANGTINKSEADWSELISSLAGGNVVDFSGLANADLSNLSAEGEAKFDTKVSKSGDTMTGRLVLEKGLKSNTGIDISADNVVKGEAPTSSDYWGIRFNDTVGEGVWADTRLGVVECSVTSDNSTALTFGVYKNEAGSTAMSSIRVAYDNAGNSYTTAPASNKINSIVTTLAYSQNTNGYYKLGNGLIIQWGQATVPAKTNTITVTLPISFTKVFKVVSNHAGSGGDPTRTNVQCAVLSTSQFQLNNTATNDAAMSRYWIAIGV